MDGHVLEGAGGDTASSVAGGELSAVVLYLLPVARERRVGPVEDGG
jgi:hypothetical protein